MLSLNHEEGRYRVLLISIGHNTKEEKESFCENISKNYSIPLPLLKKIINRCPVILKKNLSLTKAETLAKTLKAFGATVIVEERNLPSLTLEFQELVPHQLALESSTAQKTQRGTWMVQGRARNISDEMLNDTWALVQLFNDLDELIAFEEAPFTINPLPSGEASPFKIVFEGNFYIKRMSIAFKNASGSPVAAVDKRRKREWVEVMIKEGDSRLPLSSMISPGATEKPSSFDLPKPSEVVPKQESSEIPRENFVPVEREVPSFDEKEKEEAEEKEECAGEPLLLTLEKPSSEVTSEPSEEILDMSSGLFMENGYQEGEGLPKAFEDLPVQIFTPPASEELKEGTERDLELEFDRERVSEKTHLDVSVFEEATQLLENISEARGQGEAEEKGGKGGEEETPPVAWMEDFRKAVQTFYEKPRDIFSIWFEGCRKEGAFKNPLHALLTILVHSRFDQGNHSIKALENTQRVFRIIAQENLVLEDIPPLEGTAFASGEVWRELFQRALPKVQQIGNAILEKTRWSAFDLGRLVQVIPHMGHENSGMALRWVNELIPEIVEVDFSDAAVSIGESLYRVASRLGIVDPHFDYFQGRHSMGDIKIQSFAKMAFPQNPVKVEEPMARMGMALEQGGHCFPIQPQCEGCLFETFCPRCHMHFNPSEKGMRE
ncbi:MAG TPA: hypothetical protein VK551_04500 [Thermodesulfobacteriota bacterium]|nr:hypothetical protein [Thermodesulfobacteriota bacterium]